MSLFNKAVGDLRLMVENNETGMNASNILIQRVNNYNGSVPLRLTWDELRDLQYLVNRALET